MQIVKTSYSADFNGGDAQCNAVTQSQLMMNNLSFTTSRRGSKTTVRMRKPNNSWLVNISCSYTPTRNAYSWLRSWRERGRDREREERSCPWRHSGRDRLADPSCDVTTPIIGLRGCHSEVNLNARVWLTCRDNQCVTQQLRRYHTIVKKLLIIFAIKYHYSIVIKNALFISTM